MLLSIYSFKEEKTEITPKIPHIVKNLLQFLLLILVSDILNKISKEINSSLIGGNSWCGCIKFITVQTFNK